MRQTLSPKPLYKKLRRNFCGFASTCRNRKNLQDHLRKTQPAKKCQFLCGALLAISKRCPSHAFLSDARLLGIRFSFMMTSAYSNASCAQHSSVAARRSQDRKCSSTEKKRVCGVHGLLAVVMTHSKQANHHAMRPDFRRIDGAIAGICPPRFPCNHAPTMSGITTLCSEVSICGVVLHHTTKHNCHQ